MKEIRTPQEVKKLLGEKHSKGKPRGVYPDQREVVTNEAPIIGRNERGKMKGLVFGSGLTKERKYTEIFEGDDYRRDLQRYPGCYKNEP